MRAVLLILLFLLIITGGCSASRSQAKKQKEAYTDTALIKALTRPDDWVVSAKRKDIPWQLLKILHRKHNQVICDSTGCEGFSSRFAIQLTEFGYSLSDSVGFIFGTYQSCKQFYWLILFKRFYDDVYYLNFDYILYDKGDFPFTTFWEMRDHWLREIKE